MLTTFTGAGFKIDEDCKDLKSAFMFLANCTELFGAATCCENCQGTDIKPHYRKHGDYDFYELLCQNCKWAFKFGQKKDDKQLFPKGWEPPFGQENGSTPPPAAPKKVRQTDVPF